jgi:tRNA pseudouridine38-40 synthase
MRYFLEVAYKGTNYAGFQVQLNANTIQAEVEKALAILFKQKIALTGSSRTDAGVHAVQNFFHFDIQQTIEQKSLYNLNALLPTDIAINSIVPVQDHQHCRFDAVSREYKYYLHHKRNPFVADRSWFYPFPVDIDKLQAAAGLIKTTVDFSSFSKRNSQVFTHDCTILKSEWFQSEGTLVFNVKGNRFLRGMVRGLVGTMLQVARGKISLKQFQDIIEAKDCSKANFATPAHGLFLMRVEYSFLP